MKVLNLYSGLGGNRKLWEDVDVTAVEIDEETAKVYQDYFPEDEVIVADAHEYLLEHFNEYDFVWSSPPCPTHSQLRRLDTNGQKKRYPSMKLYEEIIFLDAFFDGKYVVENVKPYYTPLIPGKLVDRHMFWANFKIGNFEPENRPYIRANTGGRGSIEQFEECYGFDLSGYDYYRKDIRQMLVNCVHPETGKYIMERAKGIYRKSNEKQLELI